MTPVGIYTNPHIGEIQEKKITLSASSEKLDSFCVLVYGRKIEAMKTVLKTLAKIHPFMGGFLAGVGL